MNYSIFIWIAIIGVLFVYFWRKGHLLQLADYVRETNEELRKCNWPTWAELKASTTIVIVCIALLGGFTMLVDAVFVFLVNWIT